MELTNQNPTDLDRVFWENIRNNLRKLVTFDPQTQHKFVSQNKLAATLKENGLNIQQSTISKYVNGEIPIPLSVIILLCRHYKWRIEDFASEDFTPNLSGISTDPQEIRSLSDKDAVLLIPHLGEKFISDAKDKHFRGYLQKYHCYFYPTISREERIIHAELTLREDADSAHICIANLTIKNTQVFNQNAIVKEYSGCAVISDAVDGMYILLSSPSEGEICMINLRHFFIRHQNLDCRMAMAITNSAGQSHAPTVHRMLLSRCEIRPEHLEELKPVLLLNNNHILISKEDMEKLSQAHQEYLPLIQHITAPETAQSHTFYRLRESYMHANAIQFLGCKRLANEFVLAARRLSLADRYNKISNKVDETVHALLLERGYFKAAPREPELPEE